MTASAAADQSAMHGHLPSYRAMLDREGFAGPAEAAIIGDEAVVTERIDGLRAAGTRFAIRRCRVADSTVRSAWPPAPSGSAEWPVRGHR